MTVATWNRFSWHAAGGVRVVVIALAIIAVAGPALAHVELDAPNGGEQLAVGTTFPIQWHDVIRHGHADYDLWYSTTGPDGPWLEIAADLEPALGPGGYTYDWTVPAALSTMVRVRVRQDNLGTDYEDISDADLTILESTVAAPTADFEFTPQSPVVGEEVAFTDLSSDEPTGWLWDFGDGASSGVQNPSHVYDTEGTFTVTLTASNDAGSDSHSMALTVGPGQSGLDEMVLLPAVANAAGAGGSFFVTAVDVYNAGAGPATYRILWLPRDSDNSAPLASADLLLEAGRTRRFANLLADVFGVSDAVGAAAIMSDSADLEVMSRTFNQSDAGTFGQSLPGIAARDLIAAGTRVRILFLTEDDAYRSNLGLSSGVGIPITIGVELFAADGASLGIQTVALPPLGNAQLNRVLRAFGPIAAAHAEVWTTTAGGAFTCYGSVLDEVSSDPTTVLPR